MQLTTEASPWPDAAVRPADPDRRFRALVVDCLLAGGLLAVVGVPAARLLGTRGQVLAWAFLSLAVASTFVVLLGSTGATPGKALYRLRLVHTGTGEPIGIWPAMLRGLALAVATAPFGVGLALLAWTALTDRGRLRQGWHDHLVSSVLLDTRRPPASADPPRPAVPGLVNLTTLELHRLATLGTSAVRPD